MNDWELVGSEVIESEIDQIQDPERRENVENLLQLVRSRIVIDGTTEKQARIFHTMGLDPFDALHLACAKKAGAIFLTTDDALIKMIKKHADKITTGAHNPVQWLMEVTMDAGKDAE